MRAWMLTLAACVHPLNGPALARTTAADQELTAVRVDVECNSSDYGWDMQMNGGVASGVAITSRHVLTALHVAESCFAVIPTVYVTFADGSRWRMVVTKWLSHDAALLERADAGQWVDIYRPVVRKPVVGEPVCSVPSYPNREHRCGKVLNWTAAPNRFVVRSGTSMPGNSGAPVYGADGALLGLHSNSAPAFVPISEEWIP